VRSATTSFRAVASRRRSFTSHGPCRPPTGVSRPPGTPSTSRNTSRRRYPRGGRAPRCSPHHAALPAQCGSSLPQNTFGVWRRMFFGTCSAGALSGPDFCFIFAPSDFAPLSAMPSPAPSRHPSSTVEVSMCGRQAFEIWHIFCKGRVDFSRQVRPIGLARSLTSHCGPPR